MWWFICWLLFCWNVCIVGFLVDLYDGVVFVVFGLLVCFSCLACLLVFVCWYEELVLLFTGGYGLLIVCYFTCLFSFWLRCGLLYELLLLGSLLYVDCFCLGLLCVTLFVDFIGGLRYLDFMFDLLLSWFGCWERFVCFCVCACWFLIFDLFVWW